MNHVEQLVGTHTMLLSAMTFSEDLNDNHVKSFQGYSWSDYTLYRPRLSGNVQLS